MTMSEEQYISFEDLCLGHGQTLQAVIENSQDREFADVVLIGAIPGQSLILTAPESGLFPKMEEGQNVILRVNLALGTAVFGVKVLFISDMPLFMTYVDFPDQIKFTALRAAPRISLTMPVLLANATTGERKGVAGRIKDISLGGAAIESFEALGSIGEEVSIKGKFGVASIQRVISVKARICSARQLNERSFFYGVEFKEEEELSLLVLTGFIFHAMATQSAQTVS